MSQISNSQPCPGSPFPRGGGGGGGGIAQGLQELGSEAREGWTRGREFPTRFAALPRALAPAPAPHLRTSASFPAGAASANSVYPRPLPVPSPAPEPRAPRTPRTQGGRQESAQHSPAQPHLLRSPRPPPPSPAAPSPQRRAVIITSSLFLLPSLAKEPENSNSRCRGRLSYKTLRWVAPRLATTRKKPPCSSLALGEPGGGHPLPRAHPPPRPTRQPRPRPPPRAPARAARALRHSPFIPGPRRLVHLRWGRGCH
ncbi:hypothetical protein P7K49_027814 [Saguinus oedipus]|uniref:Uncharacterized protein n=1 Tax=Saguinus oedipus TaxID=9490 RepID=A0ABQ9UAK8_SAGOE|nr:hypothetical protein P7K49_027814 [Saguinus oedipus]